MLEAVLLAWALFVIFPIYRLLITSFKTPAAVNEGVVNMLIVVWLVYDFFNAIPRDLEEGAQLDGATLGFRPEDCHVVAAGGPDTGGQDTQGFRHRGGRDGRDHL